jgi:hypothetical protein
LSTSKTYRTTIVSTASKTDDPTFKAAKTITNFSTTQFSFPSTIIFAYKATQFTAL